MTYIFLYIPIFGRQTYIFLLIPIFGRQSYIFLYFRVSKNMLNSYLKQMLLIVSPVRRFDESSVSDVEALARELHCDEEKVLHWVDEWKVYQTEDGLWNEYERIDHYWRYIFSMKMKDGKNKYVSARAGEECLDSTTWDWIGTSVCNQNSQGCSRVYQSSQQSTSKKFPLQESSLEVLKWHMPATDKDKIVTKKKKRDS